MSIRMRHTRSHTGNRRAHHGIKPPRLSQCAKCSGWHLRHRMCDNCGTYNERQVIDAEARDAKKAERAKQKARARGMEDPEHPESKKAAQKEAEKEDK